MKIDLIKESAKSASSDKYTGPATAKIVGTANPSKEDLVKIYGPQKDAPVYAKAWPSGDKYQLVTFLLEFDKPKKTKTIEFQLQDKLIGSADGSKVMLMNEWGDILYPMDEATFNRLKKEGNQKVTDFCNKCVKQEFKDFYKLRKGEDELATFMQKYLQFRSYARISKPTETHTKWIDVCDGDYKKFFDKLHKGDMSGIAALSANPDRKVGVQLVVEVSDKGGEYEKVSTVKDGFFESWVKDPAKGMKSHYDYRISKGAHPESLPRWSEALQVYDAGTSYKMIPKTDDLDMIFGSATIEDDLPF